MIGRAPFWRSQPFVNLGAPQADIFWAEQGQRFRRCAVSARAANFLIVTLNRFGQVGVRDPADIRFVDPHAKGNRRDHNQPVFLLKATFGNAAILGVHPAVIVARKMPRLAQCACQPFGFGTGATIYDTRLPLTGGCKVKNLAPWIVLGLKCKMDVGPIKTSKESSRCDAIKQLFSDLLPGFRVCSRRKRRQWHVQGPLQLSDAQIVGAEIVAPLADAMCLVDRDHGHIYAAQHAHRRPRCQTFWRHIKQLQLSRLKRLPNGVGFCVCIAGRQGACANACFLQSAHLIAHQRNQR